MAQPGAGARRRNKSIGSWFSRKVTLKKSYDECTSFSEMRNLKDRAVIEFSSFMTQGSVRDKILEAFPYLRNKSFKCAASKRVDNDRKEFDFGESRIWDGKTIREKINGNSNLYILEDQSQVARVEEIPVEVNTNHGAAATFQQDELQGAFGKFPADLQSYSESLEGSSSTDNDSPILTSGISESDQETGETLEDIVINPKKGLKEGGYPFCIQVRKKLLGNVSSGTVEFHGVDYVMAERLNGSSKLFGTVPPRLEPGIVTVTARTKAGYFLGETDFTYVEEKTPEEVIREFVNDPYKLSSLFDSLAKPAYLSEENAYRVGYSYSLVNVRDPGSFVPMQKQQSVKFLELLLYTAAEEDAQPFVEMLFSTSAGPIVFNSYKSRRSLPEDVAQANGNDELAQYLRDINTRLSKEKPCDTESSAVNWLELAKAVQQQAAIPSDLAQGQSRGLLRNPTENDDEDNSSNNFADSSSSASSDSEDKDLPVLKKFQEDFKRFIAIGVRLSDDEAFKGKNGFTLSEFLQTRRNCAESLRRIAGHIETVTGNTGIVEATGFLRRLLLLTILCWIAAVKGGVTGCLLGLLFSVHGWINPMIRGVRGCLLGLLFSVHGWINPMIRGVRGVLLGELLLTILEWIPAGRGGVTGCLLGLLFSVHGWINPMIRGVRGCLLGLLFSVHGWINPMIRGVRGVLLGILLFTILDLIPAGRGGVTGVLRGLMLLAILGWILAVTGVRGWDYLLLCLRYNSVCQFLVEGYEAYVYQIMCKKKKLKSKNLEFLLTGRGKTHLIKFCSDY